MLLFLKSPGVIVGRLDVDLAACLGVELRQAYYQASVTITLGRRV